jgi:hypothetical protein
MPVTSHGDRLAEVGLEEVPVCGTAPDLDRVVRELLADPLNTMATSARLDAMVRTEHSWERCASEFLQHVEPLLARTDDPPAAAYPATVGFFPDYRRTNKYQKMLYANLPQHDVAVVPVDARNALVPRDPGGRLDRYLLHLHWTAPLLQAQPGPYGAELALRQFRQRVDEFQRPGWPARLDDPQRASARVPEPCDGDPAEQVSGESG